MRGKVLFVVSILAVAAAFICLTLGKTVAVYIALGVALIGFVMFYISVSRTLKTIRTGMDLLRSQDFASRLAHVGQKDADSMVDLYNSIISNLKEERLRNYEQENFLGKIIEASPTGIAICNFDGKIDRRNKAFTDFESPELLAALNALPEDTTCVIRPGGTQVLRCSRLFFMDRGFHRSFYLVERLTDEIVRAETAMFNKIVRTIGHEVNNTLGGVISVLQTLGAIHSADPEIADAVDSCVDSCKNLSDFVRSYADIVKLPDVIPVLTDLNRFVTDTLPFLREVCPASIALTTSLSPTPVLVPADTMLLQRVLLNAVKNAYESILSDPAGSGANAPGGATITIATSPSELQVIDNGPGIAPEIADKLFSPFFSTKRADRGLGLMLISDILRKHHATFTLATAPDHLTRLTIHFPHP